MEVFYNVLNMFPLYFYIAIPIGVKQIEDKPLNNWKTGLVYHLGLYFHIPKALKPITLAHNSFFKYS